MRAPTLASLSSSVSGLTFHRSAHRRRRPPAALLLERFEERRLLAALPAVTLSVPSGGSTSAAIVRVADATANQSFSFGFKHVNEAGAERYLISSTGMRKYTEWQNPPITYWGPSANGVEGRLVYRFDFGAPVDSIRLKASSPTWDFNVEPGGQGRGVSALEVSRDGQSWVAVRDNVTPRNWGGNWSIDASLPAALAGTTTLWLRMRFLVEGALNSSYTVAQFGRSTTASTANVFAVEARLRAGNSAPTGIGLSASSINANNAVGAVIGLLTAFDPDAGDRHAFSLVPGPKGNDNAMFRIVGRELQAAVSFATTSKTNYVARVRATDSGGLTVERDFTIAVTPAVSRLARLSQVPGEGYARLVQGGIYLQQGQTYRFTVRMLGPVKLQGTDHIPEFWGNCLIFDGTAKRSWVRGDWTYFESTVTPPASGFYELKLALWSRSSLVVTDVSLRSLATGVELVRNGRFLDGLANWYTHGGRLTMG